MSKYTVKFRFKKSEHLWLFATLENRKDLIILCSSDMLMERKIKDFSV